MNEYFQLDFRSNAEVLPNAPEDTISLRRETVPGLVLAASPFRAAYGDCTCSLWHWRNGAVAEDAVIGLTVSGFIGTYGKGPESQKRGSGPERACRGGGKMNRIAYDLSNLRPFREYKSRPAAKRLSAASFLKGAGIALLILGGCAAISTGAYFIENIM